MMRIRILRSIATADRAFTPGSVADVDEKTAKAWIQAGVAEQDKSLQGPSEVKENVSKISDTSSNRASDAGGSKATSTGRRKRGR